MTNKPQQEEAPADEAGAPKAGHGYRNEVTWDSGRGRQPYTNREEGAEGPPNGGDEFEAGDRGDASGRNLDQLDEAKKP